MKKIIAGLLTLTLSLGTTASARVIKRLELRGQVGDVISRTVYQASKPGIYRVTVWASNSTPLAPGAACTEAFYEAGRLVIQPAAFSNPGAGAFPIFLMSDPSRVVSGTVKLDATRPLKVGFYAWPCLPHAYDLSVFVERIARLRALGQ